MKIISLSNQKGGVGKTTSTINLGSALTLFQKKILLIDLDPQANSSSTLGIDENEKKSIYHPLLKKSPIIDNICSTPNKNLDIIPSNMDLAGVEVELASENDHLTRLKEIIEPLKNTNQYDYCLLDTPPSLGILMTSALSAADEVLIPLQCEYFGLEGLSKIVIVLDRIKKSGINPDVFVEGIVMTMYDSRTNLSRQVVDDVREHFTTVIYDTIIPRSIKLGESPSFNQSIFEYAPNSSGAIAYKKLAKEFLKRHEDKI